VLQQCECSRRHRATFSRVAGEDEDSGNEKGGKSEGVARCEVIGCHYAAASMARGTLQGDPVGLVHVSLTVLLDQGEIAECWRARRARQLRPGSAVRCLSQASGLEDPDAAVTEVLCVLVSVGLRQDLERFLQSPLEWPCRGTTAPPCQRRGPRSC
jgi:hypothetical protein